MITKISLKRRATIICALAAIFYCYEYYLRVAPSVISQELMFTFNISNAGLGMLSALFYYGYMPLQIPVGMLLDKYGPRLVLTFACALCVVGNYLFAVTDLLWLAQIGRLVVGFGSAFAFVGFLKICTNWLPHRYYAFMVGVCMLLGMFGAMGGEILLAELVLNMPWQMAMERSAWAGILITLLLWLFIRDEPTKPEAHKSIEDHKTAQLMKTLWQALKNPQIWIVGMIGCFTFLPLSSFAEMWAVPYLEAIGYTRTEAAFASSMLFLGFGIGGPLWGLGSNWLTSRRIPLILGSLISAISATFIVLDPYMHHYYMYTALFSLGFFTSAEILVFAIGNDITAKNASSTVTAIINMIVMFGGITLQPVIGMILDVISDTSVSQYQTALLILPLSLFIASALSFVLQESYKG